MTRSQCNDRARLAWAMRVFGETHSAHYGAPREDGSMQAFRTFHGPASWAKASRDFDHATGERRRR
jgi:hypothetical protein